MSGKQDAKYMAMAVAASKNSMPCTTSYRVGAVIVTRDGEVFTGYTHETDPANHAEEEAILKAHKAKASLAGGSIYSSMEPCSTRRSKSMSCTQLIIREGFARVIYALKEPPCFVNCNGDELLRKAGIEVCTLPEFVPDVEDINAHIIKK